MLRTMIVACPAGLVCLGVAVAEPITRRNAQAALHKAVHFFRKTVSAEGGYLWRYSHDLKRREGEGKGPGPGGDLGQPPEHRPWRRLLAWLTWATGVS
ncbi:MAG: hypothetical protein Ct9H300mP1_29680 [Planctomycetaceae bacterium]|nr:MAG: hypothetical protein Ct9H300mP1_29680 [Planctomycetaceae bacterium]